MSNAAVATLLRITSIFSVARSLASLSLDWFDEDNEVFVEKLIRKLMKKELLKYYMSNCSNSEARKMEQNEGELTEKCWRGYTQKGMKTMFGKRYPNCVKKTK